jgi:hypothetical protein
MNLTSLNFGTCPAIVKYTGFNVKILQLIGQIKIPKFHTMQSAQFLGANLTRLTKN